MQPSRDPLEMHLVALESIYLRWVKNSPPCGPLTRQGVGSTHPPTHPLDTPPTTSSYALETLYPSYHRRRELTNRHGGSTSCGMSAQFSPLLGNGSRSRREVTVARRERGGKMGLGPPLTHTLRRRLLRASGKCGADDARPRLHLTPPLSLVPSDLSLRPWDTRVRPLWAMTHTHTSYPRQPPEEVARTPPREDTPFFRARTRKNYAGSPALYLTDYGTTRRCFMRYPFASVKRARCSTPPTPVRSADGSSAQERRSGRGLRPRDAFTQQGARSSLAPAGSSATLDSR